MASVTIYGLDSYAATYSCDICMATEIVYSFSADDPTIIKECAECNHSYCPDCSGIGGRCPICTFKSITDTDMIQYLLASRGLTKDEVEREIRDKFDDYEDLCKTFRTKIIPPSRSVTKEG